MDTILSHYGGLATLIVSATVPIFGVSLWWMLRMGGQRRVSEWVVRQFEPRAVEARERIHAGLSLRPERPAEEQARCIDALIEGLDRWRAKTAGARTHLRCLTYCKWTLGGLVASMAGVSVCGVFPELRGTWGVALVFLWVMCFLIFALGAFLILRLVWHAGEPKADT